MTNEKFKQAQLDDAALFDAVFSGTNGVAALKRIRELSGIARATSFSIDARREAYDLGRASLYVDIERILNLNKPNA